MELRNKLRNENAKAFYEGKHVAEFEDKTLAETLQAFRARGIGILDGEIEQLAKDDAWINAKNQKLNLEKVYELRERLSAGKTMAEMFDLASLSEFLAPILEEKTPITEKIH